MKKTQCTRHDAQFLLPLVAHRRIEEICGVTGYTISQLVVIAVEMYAEAKVAAQPRKKKVERAAVRIVLPIRTDRLLSLLQASYAREGESASRQDVLDDAILHYSKKYS